jgi:hypothetical protein
MTLPYERSNAVKITRNFLVDLCTPAVTPKVPKEIRDRARQCLRHYPSFWEIDNVSKLEDNANTGFQVFGTDPWKKEKLNADS